MGAVRDKDKTETDGGEAPELTDEEIDKLLSEAGNDDGDKGEGDGPDSGGETAKSVEATMNEQMPEAMDAAPVLAELVKAISDRIEGIAASMGARLDSLEKAFGDNQEAIEGHGNALVKAIGGWFEESQDLIKSMQGQLDELGGQSTRPPDTGATPGLVLHKGGLASGAEAPMTLKECQVRLNKAVENGDLDDGQATLLELQLQSGQVSPELLKALRAVPLDK